MTWTFFCLGSFLFEDGVPSHDLCEDCVRAAGPTDGVVGVVSLAGYRGSHDSRHASRIPVHEVASVQPL